MKESYAAWIRSYVASVSPFVRGRCRAAAREMAAAFPELRIIAGFAHWRVVDAYDVGVIRTIRDQHFWCVAPDGAVVDPTASQFLGAVVAYEPLDLDDPTTRERVPSGRCMDCGADCYGVRHFCSDACQESTIASLNRGVE